MKKSLLAIILVLVSTNAMAYSDIERGCTHNRVYGVSKQQHRLNYYKCVADAYKQQEEYRKQRLQDEANQAIIDSNRTYQKNSEDMRRWMRANPGQPYPYAVPK